MSLHKSKCFVGRTEFVRFFLRLTHSTSQDPLVIVMKIYIQWNLELWDRQEWVVVKAIVVPAPSAAFAHGIDHRPYPCTKLGRRPLSKRKVLPVFAADLDDLMAPDPNDHESRPTKVLQLLVVFHLVLVSFVARLKMHFYGLGPP